MADFGSNINYNIFFPDSDGGSGIPGTPTDPQQPGQPNPQNPTQSKGGIKQLAGLAAIKQIGKSAFNYAASHVQTWTGSSDLQQKVNAGMSVIGTGIAIAVNPVLGLSMLAYNTATKALDYAYKRQQENRQTQQNLMRAGPSFNRSRREGAA